MNAQFAGQILMKEVLRVRKTCRDGLHSACSEKERPRRKIGHREDQSLFSLLRPLLTASPDGNVVSIYDDVPSAGHSLQNWSEKQGRNQIGRPRALRQSPP